MSILSQVNLDLALTQEEYQEQLASSQAALAQLGRQAYIRMRSVIVVFEGWDAAGKGSVIKHLTQSLDPRGYTVYPITAPAGEDSTHHYLYRFWRRLPERGQIAIFDTSWYGRVLAERIEGVCTEAEWSRAYREINQFERQMVDFGSILVKFWLQLSREEQLRRFQARAAAPDEAWKLTGIEEEWLNREKWDLYEPAVEEMLLRTSTLTAPWTIVEADDKRWARVKVVRTVVETLSRELEFEPALPGERLGKAIKRKVTVSAPPEAGSQEKPVAGTPERAKQTGGGQKPGKSDSGSAGLGKGKKAEKS